MIELAILASVSLATMFVYSILKSKNIELKREYSSLLDQLEYLQKDLDDKEVLLSKLKGTGV